MNIKIYKNDKILSADNMLFFVEGTVFAGNTDTTPMGVFYVVGKYYENGYVNINGTQAIPIDKFLDGYKKVGLDEVPDNFLSVLKENILQKSSSF